jgi:hypothetical protein
VRGRGRGGGDVHCRLARSWCGEEVGRFSGDGGGGSEYGWLVSWVRLGWFLFMKGKGKGKGKGRI